MEKDVVISVKAMQKYLGSEPDVVELVTKGHLRQEGLSYVVTYEESEITGLDGTQTTLSIDGDRVSLLREGEFNAQMVFQEGRRHLSMYKTPYGVMAVGVHTSHLLAEMNEQGGNVEIDYMVELDHEMVGRNIFRINVKESSSKSLKQ